MSLVPLLLCISKRTRTHKRYPESSYSYLTTKLSRQMSQRQHKRVCTKSCKWAMSLICTCVCYGKNHGVYRRQYKAYNPLEEIALEQKAEELRIRDT